MVNVIFIDDNYLYQNFPLPKRMDRGALLALIQLEQFTSIQDLLGTCLYEDLESKVEAQTLDATEEGLFKLVKYSLAMYSAKAAINFCEKLRLKLMPKSVGLFLSCLNNSKTLAHCPRYGFWFIEGRPNGSGPRSVA